MIFFIKTRDVYSFNRFLLTCACLFYIPANFVYILYSESEETWILILKKPDVSTLQTECFRGRVFSLLICSHRGVVSEHELWDKHCRYLSGHLSSSIHRRWAGARHTNTNLSERLSGNMSSQRCSSTLRRASLYPLLNGKMQAENCPLCEVVSSYMSRENEKL